MTVTVAFLLSGCSGQEGGTGTPADSSAQAGAAAPAAAPLAGVTTARFAELRWIEGTWRGSGTEQPTFYERYTFVDDSTILAQSSADSTFPDPAEGSTIRLRGGRITTGEDTMEWAASTIDARSVRFDPVRGVNNAFTWTSESDSAWVARLTWTDRDGVAHERVYQMRRMP